MKTKIRPIAIILSFFLFIAIWHLSYLALGALVADNVRTLLSGFGSFTILLFAYASFDYNLRE